MLNTVAAVEPGSPAAEAGLQAGDRITRAKIIPPSKEQLAELRKKYHDDDLGQSEVTLPFADDERNWPCLTGFCKAQASAIPILTGTTVEFTWQRGDDEEMTGKAAPVPAKDWFDSQRGWILEPMMFVQKAGSFSEALQLGGQETADATPPGLPYAPQRRRNQADLHSQLLRSLGHHPVGPAAWPRGRGWAIS